MLKSSVTATTHLQRAVSFATFTRCKWHPVCWYPCFELRFYTQNISVHFWEYTCLAYSPNVHHRINVFYRDTLWKHLFVSPATKGSGQRCHWQEDKRWRRPSIHGQKDNKRMATGRWRRFHGYLLHRNSSWSVPLVKPTHESLMLILKNYPSPRPLSPSIMRD